jgi:hypothetical protein
VPAVSRVQAAAVVQIHEFVCNSVKQSCRASGSKEISRW